VFDKYINVEDLQNKGIIISIFFLIPGWKKINNIILLWIILLLLWIILILSIILLC